MGEMTFDNPEDWRGGNEDDYSFRMIVMWYVKKILDLAAKEFRGGYWQTKLRTGSGMATATEKVYIPDSREEYCNAIDALYDLCLPWLKENQYLEMQDINKELEGLREAFIEATKADETEVLCDDFYQGEDKVLLEQYKFKKLRLHRELFQKVNMFLKDQNYFQELSIIDG